MLLTVRPLRRVTVTTVVSAATGGMLAVLAVLLVVPVTGRPADGAWLVGAVGLGDARRVLGSGAAPADRRARPRVPRLVRRARRSPICWSRWHRGIALLLGACTVVGLLTAPWVTATLAAREAHAPPGRRAEVYAGMAGWKIAAASAGTAIAGLLAGVAAAGDAGGGRRAGARQRRRHGPRPAPPLQPDISR